MRRLAYNVKEYSYTCRIMVGRRQADQPTRIIEDGIRLFPPNIKRTLVLLIVPPPKTSRTDHQSIIIAHNTIVQKGGGEWQNGVVSDAWLL